MVAIPAPSGTYQHISAISWILGYAPLFATETDFNVFGSVNVAEVPTTHWCSVALVLVAEIGHV